MSRIVKKDVLGLQIAVDNIETMQALQGAQQLSGVESRSVYVKSLFLLKMMEELAAVDES